MMTILKSYQQAIPGNYFYVEAGYNQQFGPEPFAEGIAKSLSAFRIANRIPRGSLAESLEDVDRYTCARLNNDPKFCRECDSSFEAARNNHQFFAKKCASCGTPANQ